MGQMALQYGMTGYIKRIVAGDTEAPMSMPQELASAVAGGVIVAPFASSVECVMIQQQRYVSFLETQPATSLFDRSLDPWYFSTGSQSRRDPDSHFSNVWSESHLSRIHPVCYSRRHICRGASGRHTGASRLFDREPRLRGDECRCFFRFRPIFVLLLILVLTPMLLGFWASLVGGSIVGIATCPFDAMSTAMKGDLERATYGGFVDTAKKRAAGGISVLFGGVFWRTVNITGTIYLANEARVRLGPIMFPDKY